MSQPSSSVLQRLVPTVVVGLMLLSSSNAQGDAGAAAAAAAAAADEMHRARELAKPWLMRYIEIGDTKLPITPASLITLVIVILNLVFRLFFSGPSRWAEASHILVKDTSEKTKKAMLSMKKDIGSNLKMFEEMATKYSQCPSRDQKGDLGKFKPGDMAPPFDKAVFDPSSATQTTLGPIQTQFGYHLIYIRNRKL